MKKLISLCTFFIALCAFTFKVETDKAFMITATQNNLAEIEVAKVALEKSTSDSVKAFAKMMIDDHSAAQSELASLAQSKGVALPDSTDDAHRMFKQRLMMVSGNSFDSAYLQSQVQDHLKTIDLFQGEVDKGIDPQLKAYAGKLLPKIQMHLQHVQGLVQNQMSGMNMQH
jgi:putative membrane protein